MTPITFHPDRAAWLADRSAPAPDGHAKIGASDIASIFGVGFTGPARLAAQKRGDLAREPEPGPDDPRAVGTRMEATALAEYSVHHKPDSACCVSDAICTVAHPDHPWLVVSPDARVLQDCGFEAVGCMAIGLVEVKIPRSATALATYAPDHPDGYGIAETLADPRGPAIPRNYALQVLTQLGVCRAAGLPVAWCDLWCWPSPHAHRRVRLVWDEGADAAFARLLSHVEAWRWRHIINDKPVPPGDPEDRTVVTRLWSREGQLTLAHGGEALTLCLAEWHAAACTRKVAEAREDAAKGRALGYLASLSASAVVLPDPSADPGAKRKADREGKPAKVTITGTPGGARSLRLTPGWLDSLRAPLPDVELPPIWAPASVIGLTVGDCARRWTAEGEAGAGPAQPAQVEALDADLAADLEALGL
jgi:hypothetical protein